MKIARWLGNLGTGPVGFVGYPPDLVLQRLLGSGRDLVDLDVPGPDLRLADADPHLPRVYCAILRTILVQALIRKDLAGIVVAVGPDKCEGARYVAHLLEELAACPVLTLENRARRRRETPISDSGLPLLVKVRAIMEALAGHPSPRPGPPVVPPAAFWGVPPWDLSILELLPPGTRVLGWTRCVEAGVPADLELEMEVLPDVPTIYFAQTFCAKNALARLLAQRTGGLHVEVDGRASRSSRAKIEAFLHLNGVDR